MSEWTEQTNPENPEGTDSDPHDSVGEQERESGADQRSAERLEQQTASLDAFARNGTPENLGAILDALDDAPAEEHAVIFDRLHNELRRLLDQDPSALPQGLVDNFSARDSDTEEDDASEKFA
ncbi:MULTISPECIES: hypothetical protein [Micrococcaceae]|uniref:hypothetical protein n=1 Tax=unclassified Kocuria TaxID=2649579 RepID=UPI001010F430|nr:MULTISPECIES: hypothetical protein [unclassified Kocuria]